MSANSLNDCDRRGVSPAELSPVLGSPFGNILEGIVPTPEPPRRLQLGVSGGVRVGILKRGDRESVEGVERVLVNGLPMLLGGASSSNASPASTS
jgi:hypothetical protein